MTEQWWDNFSTNYHGNNNNTHVIQGKIPQIIHHYRVLKNIKLEWISVSYIKKRTQTDGVDELGVVDSVQWGNNVRKKTNCKMWSSIMSSLRQTKQWVCVCVWSVAHKTNMKNTQNILVEKPEDKRWLWIPTYKWEDEIKLLLKITECKDMIWIHMA